LLPATGTLLDVGVVALRVSTIVPIIGLGLRGKLLRCRLLDIYRRSHGRSDHGWGIGIIRIPTIIGIPSVVT
jgi:hypothetical protein